MSTSNVVYLNRKTARLQFGQEKPNNHLHEGEVLCFNQHTGQHEYMYVSHNDAAGRAWPQLQPGWVAGYAPGNNVCHIWRE